MFIPSNMFNNFPIIFPPTLLFHPTRLFGTLEYIYIYIYIYAKLYVYIIGKLVGVGKPARLNYTTANNQLLIILITKGILEFQIQVLHYY